MITTLQMFKLFLIFLWFNNYHYPVLSDDFNIHEVNFYNMSTYLDSIRDIRQYVGEPIEERRVDNVNLYRMRDRSALTINALVVSVRGYPDEDPSNRVLLVFNLTNLYLTGFILDGNHYVTHDAPNYHNLRNLNTIQLTQSPNNAFTSSYTDLVRFAGNIDRGSMRTSLESLSHNLRFLNNYPPSSGNPLKTVAQGFLQFITIIPEAIRFRQIQARIMRALYDRSTGEPSGGEFTLEESGVWLTLNWDSLSTAIANTIPTEVIRIGNEAVRIYLRNAREILGILGLILSCDVKPRPIRDAYYDYDQCTNDDKFIKINNVFWSKAFLLAILS